MNGSILILVFLFVYFAVISVIGIVSRRKSVGECGYFLANRSLGFWTATSTLAATTIGGSATILVIGQVYAHGLAFIWTDLAGGTALIILGVFLAKKVRSMDVYSLPEIAGKFYGSVVRRISAVLVLIAEIGFLALLLRGAISLLQPFLQLHPLATLSFVSGIFIFYTLIGGQLAVARTDIVQLLLMFAGFVFALIYLGSLPGIWTSVPVQHWSFPVSEQFPVFSVLSLIIITGMPHIVGSDIYAKVLSSKDNRTARLSATTAGVLKIMVGIVVGLLGILAAGLLAPGLKPDEVLSTLILTLLPEALAAFIVLAFLATLMSSADSVLLTAGTVLTRDILRIRGERSHKAGRVATAAIGIVGIVLTAQFSSMLSAFLFAYTLFTASLVIPILLGFWRDKLRITRYGAAAAMTGGGLSVIVTSLLGWHAHHITLSGLLFSSVLLFAVSLATRKHRFGET